MNPFSQPPSSDQRSSTSNGRTATWAHPHSRSRNAIYHPSHERFAPTSRYGESPQRWSGQAEHTSSYQHYQYYYCPPADQNPWNNHALHYQDQREHAEQEYASYENGSFSPYQHNQFQDSSSVEGHNPGIFRLPPSSVPKYRRQARHRSTDPFANHSSSTMLVTPTRPERLENEFVSITNGDDLLPNSSENIQRANSATRSSNSVIWELQENDVLCGRGAPTNFHFGNQSFRELVQEHQASYIVSKRSDKPAIAWKLFDIVSSRGGRFVRRNKACTRQGPACNSSFGWEELTEKQAYEKICQALREGAPELRRRMFDDIRGQHRQVSPPKMEASETEIHRDQDNENRESQNEEGRARGIKSLPPQGQGIVADTEDTPEDVFAV